MGGVPLASRLCGTLRHIAAKLTQRAAPWRLAVPRIRCEHNFTVFNECCMTKVLSRVDKTDLTTATATVDMYETTPDK